jgi:hypothetical protein
MSLSGKTDNPSFVLRGIHDTVYEDVSPAMTSQAAIPKLNIYHESLETNS